MVAIQRIILKYTHRCLDGWYPDQRKKRESVLSKWWTLPSRRYRVLRILTCMIDNVQCIRKVPPYEVDGTKEWEFSLCDIQYKEKEGRREKPGIALELRRTVFQNKSLQSKRVRQSNLTTNRFSTHRRAQEEPKSWKMHWRLSSSPRSSETGSINDLTTSCLWWPSVLNTKKPQSIAEWLLLSTEKVLLVPHWSIRKRLFYRNIVDVEKAFHEIQIASDNIQMLKFLWLDRGTRAREGWGGGWGGGYSHMWAV